MEKIRGAGFVGVVDVLFGPLATTADVVLAGRMWAEKAGTVVNSLGMEQQFAPAVSGPPQTRTECDILRELTRLVSVTDADSSGATS
jgi:NADH dehydrogenase/NADH:ubiquinone oxidoreductase subunit G